MEAQGKVQGLNLMAVKIKFLGGVRTVTGSSHLISTDKSQLLLDVGLFQGHRDEAYQINTAFNYNPHKLNAVVLSGPKCKKTIC